MTLTSTTTEISSFRIGCGDRLGAQMYNLASLYMLAMKIYGRVVLLSELAEFENGYEFDSYFCISSHVVRESRSRVVRHLYKIISRLLTSSRVREEQRSTKALLMRGVNKMYFRYVQWRYRDFKRKVCSRYREFDESLLTLESGRYDISGGLGVYEDWGNNREIYELFRYRREVVDTALSQLKELTSQYGHLETVAVHYRRGDYLKVASHRCKESYYRDAISRFRPDRHLLVIFSDDITGVTLPKGAEAFNCVKIGESNPGVSMCMISLCTNKIISNSTFSFWGAMLGNRCHGTVICPIEFVSDVSEESAMNGRYYPKEWISLHSKSGV